MGQMADDVDGHTVSQTTHDLTTPGLNVQWIFLIHFGLLNLANAVLVAAGKAVAHHFAANADGNVAVVECAKAMTQAQHAFALQNLGQAGRLPRALLVTPDVVTDGLLVQHHLKMIP